MPHVQKREQKDRGDGELAMGEQLEDKEGRDLLWK